MSFRFETETFRNVLTPSLLQNSSSTPSGSPPALAAASLLLARLFHGKILATILRIRLFSRWQTLLTLDNTFLAPKFHGGSFVELSRYICGFAGSKMTGWTGFADCASAGFVVAGWTGFTISGLAGSSFRDVWGVLGSWRFESIFLKIGLGPYFIVQLSKNLNCELVIVFC